MTEKKYPYTGWVLTPSYKPKQVTFVEGLGWGVSKTHDKSDAGKSYSLSDIYPTKAKAIEGGRLRLEDQLQKLMKMQDSINKRRSALDKAESE